MTTRFRSLARPQRGREYALAVAANATGSTRISSGSSAGQVAFSEPVILCSEQTGAGGRAPAMSALRERA